VGDHHDGLSHLAHRGAEERQDRGAAARVQVAGGLVGEDDVRPARQAPGAGDPLLLAAGQLGRPVSQSGPQAHGVDDAVQPGPVWVRPAMSIGSVMFSSAVSVGSRLNAWKMKPTLSRRSRVRPLSSSVLISVSPIHARPPLRRPARPCSA
jgi:hypothetical protein